MRGGAAPAPLHCPPSPALLQPSEVCFLCRKVGAGTSGGRTASRLSESCLPAQALTEADASSHLQTQSSSGEPVGIDGLVLPEIASGCARACAGLSAQTRPSRSSCSASLMTGNCPPVPDGWRLFLQQEAWARCQGGGLGGSPLGAVPRAVGRQLTLVLPWGSGSSRAGSLCVPGVLEPAECPGRAGSRWPREVKAQETPGGEDYSWQLLFCQDCSGEAHP